MDTKEINYPELYRNSGTMDEFVKKVIEQGGEESEAVMFWYELTAKYEDRY